VTASRGTDNSTTATDHGPRAVRDALAQLVAAIVVHARRIRLPNSTSRSDTQPEQLERRARLVSAIAKGRRWLDDVVSGRVTTVQEICVRESCSVRQVNMTMSLAFLAPDLVKAAVEGRLPRGIGIERLRDPPTEWSRQFEALGLNPE
jgi:site-specific DNA recombinase